MELDKNKHNEKIKNINNNITDIEEQVLEFWNKNNIFEKSINLNKEKFKFFDGPPFATGDPHYGHILVANIKDTICRFQTVANNKSIPRVAGWDCHGLPIEYEIEKKLGIKTKEQVLEFGIDNYNKECKNVVMKCEDNWKKTIGRIGRWLDFDNSYKTMDIDYMEKVWWVFKQLYDKNLITRDFRVMPYSIACNTPLSNFEANSNYKDINEQSIIVSFISTDPKLCLFSDKVNILVWTTTPWTLVANTSLCVNPDFNYNFISCDDKVYICVEEQTESLFVGKDIEIKKIIKGSELQNIEYNPIFNYNKNISNFKIVSDTFVLNSSGTGIVHLAPAFGEDDYNVCKKNNIITSDTIFIPIDENGKYTNVISDYKGENIFDCNKKIIKLIENNNQLFMRKQIKHSYPFCWRSDTKLIYLACPSWFVKVTEIKDKIIQNNKNINWVPKHVGENRFGKWLENAKDWNISRNRYWGTPLPIWISEDLSEIKVFGSKSELEKECGKTLTDLHRDSIDDIILTSKSGKKLKRIEEVFDCWFESGSMPFTQKDGIQIADFISEGLDQTRGWFYTLLVLSTAIQNKSPFKNVIVNGLVLAEDGKKMSKRLKNYPNIMDIVNKYGSDALRMYLLSSGAVMSEPVRFLESQIHNILKTSSIQLLNSINFFQEHYTFYKKYFNDDKLEDSNKSTNLMDKWILSEVNILKNKIYQDINNYKLNNIGNLICNFINNLNNWYIAFNRKRMKNKFNKHDFSVSLSTLKNVLKYLCIIISPFYPFLSEHLYNKLKDESDPESVHLYKWDLLPKYEIDYNLERQFLLLQNICNCVRQYRGRKNICLKKPFLKVKVYVDSDVKCNDLKILETYMKNSCNISEINIIKKDIKFNYKIKLNFKEYGKIWGKYSKEIIGNINKNVSQIIENKGFNFRDSFLEIGKELIIEKELDKSVDGIYEELTNSLIDINDKVDLEKYKISLINHEIQQFRKELNLHIWDTINIYLNSNENSTMEFLNKIKHNFPDQNENIINIGDHQKGDLKIITIDKMTINIMVVKC